MKRLNVPLLLMVREAILKEPKQFIMDHWFSDQTDIRKRGTDYRHRPNAYEIPNCGTAACIAGWVVTIGNGKTPREIAIQHLLGVKTEACNLLNVDGYDASFLFYVTNWSPHYRKAWKATRSPAKRALIAAKVIDNFIRRHK